MFFFPFSLAFETQTRVGSLLHLMLGDVLQMMRANLFQLIVGKSVADCAWAALRPGTALTQSAQTSSTPPPRRSELPSALIYRAACSVLFTRCAASSANLLTPAPRSRQTDMVDFFSRHTGMYLMPVNANQSVSFSFVFLSRYFSWISFPLYPTLPYPGQFFFFQALYAQLGVRSALVRACHDLPSRIELRCDGQLVDLPGTYTAVYVVGAKFSRQRTSSVFTLFSTHFFFFVIHECEEGSVRDLSWQ